MLGGGVQDELTRVPGTTDLWSASFALPRLDEAVVSVVVLATRDGEEPYGRPADAVRLWHGPAAEPVPDGTGPVDLAGRVDVAVLDAPAPVGPREVTVVRPADGASGGPLPVCLLADGESATAMAGALDAAVAAGRCPPVLLVGVASSTEPPRPSRSRRWDHLDGRTREYVPGADRRRFAAHLRFVTDVVLPGLDDVAPGTAALADLSQVVAAGFSNGAAWAVAAAQRRPDVLSGVVALSPGVVPGRVRRAAHVPTYLAAGLYEEGFLRSSREWADRLARAGVPHRHEEWVGGHDFCWWVHRLPVGLAAVLGPLRG